MNAIEKIIAWLLVNGVGTCICSGLAILTERCEYDTDRFVALCLVTFLWLVCVVLSTTACIKCYREEKEQEERRNRFFNRYF